LSCWASPSNDFMGQEPGTAEEIRSFCDTNYQVSFPLFAKVMVKGDGKDGLYSWLTGGGLEEPTWNFTKYLVGRDGKVIAPLRAQDRARRCRASRGDHEGARRGLGASC
jgi:glutathione peroxidase-family protein